MARSLTALPFAAAVLTAVFGTLLCETGRASEGPPPKLDPETYASPSGEYELHVDPTREDGGGPGTYRFSRGGQAVWAKTLPFTLWDAVVTDRGEVAGLAYTEGWRDIGVEGEFVVAILAPDGAPRVVDRTPRTQSRFFHTPPNPRAVGRFVQSERDRFVVRLADPDVNQPDETWLAFRLSDGTKLDPILPNRWIADRAGRWSALEARPIPGTPLLLTHWYLLTDLHADLEMGGAFTVTDPAGSIVWEKELPGDYEAPAEAEDRWAARDAVSEHGAVLPTAGDGRFAVWFVRDGQRVEYAVAGDAEAGWKVTETGRAPFSLPEPEAEPDPAAEAAPIELTFLGSIELGTAPKAAGPVRDVSAFDVDDRGRIGFVRGGASDADPQTFVLVDPAAENPTPVTTVVPAGLSELESHGTLLDWTGGDRWILVASPFGAQQTARAWTIDAAAGTATLLTGLDAPGLEAIDGTGDGGFVGLVVARGEYASTEWLARFGPDGRTKWRVDESYEDPHEVFSPEDVAVSAAGRIGVVSAVGKDVRTFSADGKHLRTTKLKDWLGREPNYPSGLSADGPGDDSNEDRWTLHDFHGQPPVVRLGPGTTVRAQFTPRFPDGRAVDFLRLVRSPQDGRLWTSDGESMMRLDEEGVVDRALGTPPDADVLREVAALAVGPRGNLYAVDARSGSVHVLDADGRRVRVLTPDPADFGKTLSRPRIAIAPDGAVYLAPGLARGQDEYVRFAPSGERTGRVTAGRGISNEWRLRPDGGRWVGQYETVELFAPDGTLKTTVRRRPDGAWLRAPIELAIFPDGGLAAADPDGLHLYDPSGEPVRTLPLPDGWVLGVAAAARWVAVSKGDGGLFLVPRAGGPLRRFAPPPREGDPDEAFPVPLTDPAGRQLWLHRYGARRVDRYALPE